MTTIGQLNQLIDEAAKRLEEHVSRTPLRTVDARRDIHWKLENEQLTGSFKLRGALNRLLVMPAEDRPRGCVTASSGNHGAAVACAMQRLGMRGVIFVPEGTSTQKVERIRSFGADVTFHGTDGLDTELHARRYARERSMVYVSPYNDEQVIAGQGTIACELLQQLSDIRRVLVAVGGGGLISGIGAKLKSALPGVELIGCQPEASAVMADSVAEGMIVERDSLPTLSDGTAGGVEPDAITFTYCQALVDRFLRIDEQSIREDIRRAWCDYGIRMEGAAAVATAAVEALPPSDGATVVIICGGNIADTVFTEVTGG